MKGHLICRTKRSLPARRSRHLQRQSARRVLLRFSSAQASCSWLASQTPAFFMTPRTTAGTRSHFPATEALIMLTRMMAAGLLAGLVSGLFASGMQQVTTVPLILRAEAYERAAAEAARVQHSANVPDGKVKLVLVHGDAHEVPGDGHGAPGDKAADGASSWTPADGFERTAATTVATIGAAAGFALMLLAVMLASGAQITPRSAVLWSAAAFAATGLAPALGLPPELPGSAAADIIPRQLWWVATAAATAAGLWLIFKPSGPPRIAAGLALLVIPHLAGAPHPGAFTSTAPAELAAQFTSASLAVHAVLWTLTGAASGYFWQRFARLQT